MKNITIICILICCFLSGCEQDDRYLYIHSYRVTNKIESFVSGYLILQPVYVEDTVIFRDSVFFQIASGETVEILDQDGGNGPDINPIRRDNSVLKELHLNINNTILNVNIESNDVWEYRTEKSTAIYTFSITEDLL